MADYVNKAELYAELLEHWPKVQEAKRLGLPMPMVSESIALQFKLIVDNLAKRYNFNRYSFLDDMRSRGNIACLTKAHCFDPGKSNNPFGYFSRIAWQEFVNEIKDEEGESYIKAKLCFDLDVQVAEGDMEDSGGIATPFFNVEDYERKNGIRNAMTPVEAKVKKNPHRETTGPLLEEGEE